MAIISIERSLRIMAKKKKKNPSAASEQHMESAEPAESVPQTITTTESAPTEDNLAR